MGHRQRSIIYPSSPKISFDHSTHETELNMKWILVLQFFTIHLATSLAQENQGSCSGGQECVSYKDCLHGKKLFGRILAKSDVDPEKTELMEQFKDLRCKNFNRDKTVCCDVEGLTYLGSFSNHLHGVSGDMYAIDGIDNQLQIRRFKYDGTGSDTFFWAGTKGKTPDSDGFVMEYPFKGQFYSYDDHNVPVLPEFTGNEEPIVLTLPNDKKVYDLMWISVWDRTWSTSFGEVTLKQKNFPKHF